MVWNEHTQFDIFVFRRDPHSIFLYFVGILTYTVQLRMNKGSTAADIAARKPPTWLSRRQNERAVPSCSIFLATPGCGGAGQGGG